MPIEFRVKEGLDDLKTRLANRIQVEEAKLRRFNFSVRVRMEIEQRIMQLKKKRENL